MRAMYHNGSREMILDFPSDLLPPSAIDAYVVEADDEDSGSTMRLCLAFRFVGFIEPEVLAAELVSCEASTFAPAPEPTEYADGWADEPWVVCARVECDPDPEPAPKMRKVSR